jgi:hypothetical protein
MTIVISSFFIININKHKHKQIKNQRKNAQTSFRYGRKTNFPVILKIGAIFHHFSENRFENFHVCPSNKVL